MIKAKTNPGQPFAMLADHIQSVSGLSLTPREKLEVEAKCRIKSIGKKQFVFRAGDINRHLTFILVGSMRMFSVDAKGKEHTITLATENCWIYDHESLKQQLPGAFYIETEEDCLILQFSSEHAMQLRSSIPAFGKMLAINNLNELMATQNRFYASISMPAEERYEHFISTFPGLAGRFPQNVIASYLGMTFETLSRLKKQKAALPA